MTISKSADNLIKQYRLQPHPEGGWYREVHRSSRSVGQLPGYPGERVALTAIYFLLLAGEFSAFHRVSSEEIWVHLAGAPLELVLLGEEPRFITIAAAGSGEPLAAVPPFILQAARPLGEFAMTACFVAPGFDFADFEMPSRKRLLEEYPGKGELIGRFTR